MQATLLQLAGDVEKNPGPGKFFFLPFLISFGKLCRNIVKPAFRVFGI